MRPGGAAPRARCASVDSPRARLQGTPRFGRSPSCLGVNPQQAGIVQRIFDDYARGVSPRTIAKQLNRDGVPGSQRQGMGPEHDPRQLAAGHGHPQQRGPDRFN
jgi:hypothetical protein